MTVSPNLIKRYVGVIDLTIRRRAGVYSYKVGAARSLDAAFTGTTELATVRSGRHVRSRTLRRTRRGMDAMSIRNLTRFAYAPEDFVSATVPSDEEIAFIRVSEVDLGGNDLGEGPVLVVPPAGFFASGRNTLFLPGTGPDVSGLANNLPPPDALIIDFPKFIDELNIQNTDGTNSLFVSPGPGLPEREISAGEDITIYQGRAGPLYIRGDSAAVGFQITAVLVSGIQS